MNSKNWIQVYQNQIFLNPDDPNYINIRVSTTPDLVGVITDIRKFVGKKATRLGVGLFPDELSYLWEMAPKKINCAKQFDFRRIKLEFEHDITAITVVKTDWSEQKMYLSDNQMDRLFGLEKEIKDAIVEACKEVKME